MTHDLDTFEAQLLTELRATVDSGSRVAPVRRRRVAAVATLAAALAAAVTLPGILASPAYAVQDGPGGTVKVQVDRLEDAPGLQAALIDHGVPAVVTYLGHDLTCAPGRYQEAESSTPGSTTTGSFGTGGISVEIDRRDVAHGETVVIEASRITDGSHFSFGFAAGPVRDCRPVPLPRDQR